jgi:glucosamine-6-phosphate deaminase
LRNFSKINPDWWDYTTLDPEILKDAERLTAEDLSRLSRPGFLVTLHDTRESFCLAEALEYIQVWRRAKEDEPAGICGPIGPTAHLPLVAQIVNDLEINLQNGHFWAMDEWYIDGREIPVSHPLSFARANLELCFGRIKKELRMPAENLHFLREDNLGEYSKSFDRVHCLIMQGGQGEAKHWAFNDPVKREGQFKDRPPSPEEYGKLGTRVVDLHPLTLIQSARSSWGGLVSNVPSQAITVGPLETWKAEKVSIWHGGNHENPFGMKLTTLMISKGIADSSVPISLLGKHPHVQFNLLRPAFGGC